MAYRTIKLKAFGEPAIAEYKADAAITPGMLVQKSTTGVAKHATAGASCIKAFALEQGGIGGAVATDIASGAQCQVWFPRSGDMVAGLLLASENVAIGDKLEPGANGTLRKVVADTSAGTIALESVVGFAEEASNVGSNVLIKVRVF